MHMHTCMGGAGGAVPKLCLMFVGASGGPTPAATASAANAFASAVPADTSPLAHGASLMSGPSATVTRRPPGRPASPCGPMLRLPAAPRVTPGRIATLEKRRGRCCSLASAPTGELKCTATGGTGHGSAEMFDSVDLLICPTGLTEMFRPHDPHARN